MADQTPQDRNQAFLALMGRELRNQIPSLFARGRAGFVSGPGTEIDPPGRDLDAECGYPDAPSLETYWKLYRRGGIAKVVVDKWPNECWASYPELYETDKPVVTKFERAWRRLEERVQPWHYLHRVDKLQGVGHFAGLFLGLEAGGRDLSLPPPNVDPATGLLTDPAKPHTLSYLRAFGEGAIRVDALETNLASPRYGHPTHYSLNFADDYGAAGSSLPVANATVHWTRVFHTADNLESSEVSGTPRMEAGLNYILDIRKVSGSSGEMFWKGGFPGFQFETYPDLAGESAVDVEAVEEEVKNYVNGLRRYLSGVGGKWNPIPIQVADPSNHLDKLIALLAATIDIPVIILMGSEAGVLAGSTAVGTWKERVQGRQANYLEPRMVRPFASRLTGLGCLPTPKRVLLAWRDLNTLSDTDLASVALKKVQAMMQYVTGSVFLLMPPRYLFTLVLGYSDSQAQAIIDALGGEDKVAAKLEAMSAAGAVPDKGAAPKGGGRIGNPVTAPVGRPPVNGSLPN